MLEQTEDASITKKDMWQLGIDLPKVTPPLCLYKHKSCLTDENDIMKEIKKAHCMAEEALLGPNTSPFLQHPNGYKPWWPESKVDNKQDLRLRKTRT